MQASYLLVLPPFGLKLFPVIQESLAPETLRLATPYSVPLTSVDPASVPDLVTYQAIASLFSRLVYFKEANELSLMAAESLDWNGATLSIKVRRWKTVDGYEISAEDAAISLRRLFILDSNSHGFVKDDFYKDTSLLVYEFSSARLGMNADERRQSPRTSPS